ncbi:MAG TPA: PaaI family thioesterase [Burkholderiaceae bacterium]|nr:PaaI family thioesterase [Burkholderiaceae bacterium]
MNTATVDAPLWREHQPAGLMSTLGPLLSRREGDSWVYGLRLDERHLNLAGIVHGGTFTTLLDHAISTIAWERSGKQACVTVQLNTSFMKPARAGQLLAARAQLHHASGSMLFLDATLHADEVLVATAQAVMKRLAPR